MRNGHTSRQIGKKLRELRHAYQEQRGMGGKEFADEVMGISRQMIYAIENGSRNLSLSTLRQFSRVFKITETELLNGKRKTA